MSDSAPTPAGWFPDPMKKYTHRYWDGVQWTSHVATNGVQGTDEISTSPTEATQPVEHETTSAPPSATSTTTPANRPSKIPFFGARKVAHGLQAEIARLEGVIEKYGLLEVDALDAAKASIESDISDARTRLDGVTHMIRVAEQQREAIQADIVNLRDVAGLQEYGLFDYENPAESSVALATERESVAAQIKQSVRNGNATIAASTFTFNNSAAKGRKFVSDMSKLLLRAYNAEAENCVKTVKAGNLAAAQKRLTTVAQQVERLGSMIQLSITPQYHYLRLKELELVSRHMQALQAEKERERAHRDELREQRKAEQELAREKERLEKERQHYLNTIATLESNGDLEGAARIRIKLADVDRAMQDVDYRAANIRAGYVYVISNIGAFGPDVVKIGLTRRLEPMDRVNELGDASVPFRFDVHALFFAEDAVSIEGALHAHFADRRINLINLRREYFRATPAEVLEALKEHDVEVLEFTVDPAAIEYRASLDQLTRRE